MEQPSPEEKTRMHTQNVNRNIKVAAQETAGRCEEKPCRDGAGTLTHAQMRDLLLYIGDNSEQQKQPAFYIPPENAGITILRSAPQGLQIVLFMVEGWPEAIAVPEAGYLAVLTGIPL
jgi:hypothetical protein